MTYQYNRNIVKNAKILRKNQTEEERKLWYTFLNKLPYKFRRQKTIGNYIVDFYCAEKKLVIELDGSQHYQEDNALNDKLRDLYLNGLGIKVLRYSNRDINEKFNSVCQDIYKYLNI